MTNTEYAAGLRTLADLYEQNPDMAQPYGELHMITTQRKEYEATVAALNPQTIKDDGRKFEFHITSPVAIHVSGLKEFMGYRKVTRLVECEVWELPAGQPAPEVANG